MDADAGRNAFGAAGHGRHYLTANFPAERCGESSVAGDNFPTFLQDFVQTSDDWLEQLKDLAENAPINILTFTHLGPADIDRTQATYEALSVSASCWRWTR